MKIYLITCLVFISLVTNAQNIGIGNLSPSEKLDVTGNLKADTLKAKVLKIAPNASPGKVLVSDAFGNARWQSAGNTTKVYNGLTKVNDTINFGGRLYNTSTEIQLAKNELSFTDVGATNLLLAGSTPAASNVVLSSTPITQTFTPSSGAQLFEVRLNLTAVNGGSVVLQLKNSSGEVLGSTSKNYTILTNGLDAFTFNVYVENTQTYTLSITGNASVFLNYNSSSNSYPGGSSSLGANADLAFNVFGKREENLLSLKANKVGIGTNTPDEKLEVNGNMKATNIIATNSLKLTNGAGLGKVLTSDAGGTGSWEGARTIPGTINLVANIYGAIGVSIPLVANTWEFFGPSSSVTLNGNQRVVINVVAGLGRMGAGTNTFRLDIGYQLQSGGPISNAAGNNYIISQPIFTGTESFSWPMTGSFKPAAGVYKIGCMVYSSIAGYLNNTDYINGYYMIVNE